MKNLIFILLISPLIASSQTPDLGFWEDRQPLPGCKIFEITRNNGPTGLSIVADIVDCYGDKKRVNIGVVDFGKSWICSMEQPVTGPFPQPTIESIYDCDGNVIGTPCNEETDAAGQNEFPAEFVSEIGSFQGNVSFHFTTGDVPDKVVVERLDGTVVYTTGWRGSTAYQQQLNDGLAARGLPPETIQGPGGTGGAEYTFNKNFPDPTVRFKVYTSYWITGGSSWWVTVHCPN